MKKILLSILMIFSFISASCNGSNGGTSSTISVDSNYFYHGLSQMNLIYDNFYYNGANIFTAFNPADSTPGSEFKGSSSLWAYGAVLTMTAAAAKLNPNDPIILDRANNAIKGLKNYRMPMHQLIYTSNLDGGGEPYYDDNAWVVLGLFDLAKAYDNDEYMTQSRTLLDYVLSGESEDGGVYWKETVQSRNTCSSGPAVVGALLHYIEDPDENAALLDIAKRIYKWTKDTLRDPSDFVYWDNAIMQEDGSESINKWKFTYNSGTMVWAASLLYQITQDETYLKDANDTATGALAHFYNKGLDNRYYYPKSPWFNLYLLRGFMALAQQYKDGARDYLVNTFRSNMNIALLTGLDERGFIRTGWGGGSITSTDKFVDLKDAAASAEVLFLIAYYEINIEKVK